MSELDSFRIDSKLVKIDNNCRLGTGSFGTVHGGIYNNRKVAIKKIHSSPHLTINHVYREIRILAGCVHDAIIHFVGFYEKPQKPNIVYLVTEMADDSLAEVLIPTAYHDIKIVDNGKLELFWIDHYNFAHALHWMLMAAEGIAYLHSREIIHRDVKPSNMLLFDQHRILKLCDFGTVTRFDTMTYNQQGTARYCAPEVYRTQCSYSIDIYSWGITFWEVIARRYPFEYLHHCLQIVFSTNEREKPSKILGVPDVVEDLYVQCYHHDASQRPSAEDLVKILTEWLSHFQDLRCEEIDRVGPYYFDENECPVIFSLSSSESELEDTNPPNAVTSDGNIRDFEVVSKDDCHNYLEAEVNRPRRLSDSSCPLPNGKPELPRAFSHSSITSHVKSIFGSFVDVLAHPALKRHSTVEQCNSRDLDPIPYHNLTPSKPVKGDKVSESIYANHQNAYEEWVDLQRNILQIKENCKFVNVDIENISKIQNAEELVNHLISLNNSLEQEITTLKQTSNSDERFINV